MPRKRLAERSVESQSNDEAQPTVSVVAGCSLFNGVLLAADSRITYRWPNGREEYADVAQKLFPVAHGTAIGFVSDDVRVASLMLRVLLRQVRTRPHADPQSLAHWMPRLFRWVSEDWRQRHGEPAYTAFMVASVVPWMRNVVRRADVAALLNRIGFGNPAIQRNWIPEILIRVLETPSTTTYVRINGTALGALYTMEAPDFVPSMLRPLSFTAIGSGRGVVRDIERVHDWIFAGDVGNHHAEAMSFNESIERFARENGILTVGGLYPILRVDGTVGGNLIECWGSTREIPVGGARIQLAYENGSWIQRNLTTGRELRLYPPWRIDPLRHAGVFDEVEEAYARMRHESERL